MKRDSYLPNCDRCGRFMNPNKKGTSQAFVPDSEVSYEEMLFRCVECTKKHGAPIPRQSVDLRVTQFYQT